MHRTFYLWDTFTCKKISNVCVSYLLFLTPCVSYLVFLTFTHHAGGVTLDLAIKKMLLNPYWPILILVVLQAPVGIVAVEVLTVTLSH